MAQCVFVLYGAGSLGRLFAQHNRNAFSGRVVFTDSNPSTWGQTIDGISVFEPTEANLAQGSNFVITTMWVRDVYNTLRRLGVPHERIWVPTKPMIYGRQSIFTPEVSDRAVGLINNAFSVLPKRISAFVDLGTLLGLWRDDSLIPHDEDIDISVVGISGTEHRQVADVFSSVASRMKWEVCTNSTPNSSLITLSGDDVVVPIGIDQVVVVAGVLYYPQNPHFPPVDAGMVFPLKRLGSSSNIRVPNDADAYLQKRYGDSWQIPTSDWPYLYGAHDLGLQVISSLEDLQSD